VAVGNGCLLCGQGFLGPFAKVKTREAVRRETRDEDATRNPSWTNLRTPGTLLGWTQSGIWK